jgi:predicted Rossmann-fold nucleotide-binding protein
MKKTTKIIKRVAFFGDAMAKKSEESFIAAKETARLLAENGYIIVNGGGPGIMLASTLGAKEGKGKVEIVTMDPKVNMGKNFEGSSEENTSKADKWYKEKDYLKREGKLIEIADAFVIFKGGTGTISEIGLTWSLAKFDFGHHEPLIFFGNFWKQILRDLGKDLDLEKKEQEVYTIVDRPEDVLRVIIKSTCLKK